MCPTRYIKERHGDYFGITMAGYPEAHPDVISDDPDQMKEAYWNDIRYLKQKVRRSSLGGCSGVEHPSGVHSIPCLGMMAHV